MSPPPPRPEDDPPPAAPASGWEVVEPAPPARDPILDDPLFAELVEAKPLPDLSIEPAAPPPLPVAEPVEDVPTAEVDAAPRAAPVAPARRGSDAPRPRPVPPPPRPREDAGDAPQPRVLMACGVMGCFGLALLGALGFIAYAAIYLLSVVADPRAGSSARGAGARPEPVGPTTMDSARAAVVLPGRVDAIGRAAGGRFLLLRVARTGEVLPFDPNTGQVGKPFAPGAPGSLFAGSASKLFVWRPGANGDTFERWDLHTGEREASVPRPPGVPRPDALAAGAGVDGPVYLLNLPENGSATLRTLDPGTLLPGGDLVTLGGLKGGRPPAHVRASDDGTLLGVNGMDGAQLIRVPPAAPAATQRLGNLIGTAPPLATPARDGRRAYTPAGLYDPTGARKSDGTPYSFPAAHGAGLFLSIDRKGFTQKLSTTIRVHPAAAPAQGGELTGIEAPAGLLATDAGDVPPDQRVHFWPAAGLVAVLTTPEKGEQHLDVRKVDVPAILNDFTGPYLVFGSEPRLWVVRGQEWRYRAVVWAGGQPAPFPVKVEGPRGLVLRGGEFVWTPGRDDAAATADVVIRVTAGDQTAEQRFRVTVLDDADDD